MMNGYFNLNQLAMITGLTTRTLRNYIASGVLGGEKRDGVWSFTEEEVDAFVSNEAVRRSISARQNGVVLDFLADVYKRSNRICVIMDLAGGPEELQEASACFCKAISERGRDIEFRSRREKQVSRVILAGGEDQVIDLLREYYGAH